MRRHGSRRTLVVVASPHPPMEALVTSEPTVSIRLPLTDEQATAIIVAAHALGVEPWALAVHVLMWRVHDRR